METSQQLLSSVLLDGSFWFCFQSLNTRWASWTSVGSAVDAAASGPPSVGGPDWDTQP